MANEVRGGQGQVLEPETFRDSVGTMDQTGKRKWVYPRKPKGKYTNYRTIVAISLLTIFFITPFIKISGNPFLMINILDRQFYIIGQPFYPQDFFIFGSWGYCFSNIHYPLYRSFRTNFLWLDLPTNYFSGNGLP